MAQIRKVLKKDIEQLHSMSTSKLPTAREFYDAHYSDDAVVMMKDFAKLHVEACKEEIADDYLYYLDGDEGSERLDCKKFNKEAYPLENIK